MTGGILTGGILSRGDFGWGDSVQGDFVRGDIVRGDIVRGDFVLEPLQTCRHRPMVIGAFLAAEFTSYFLFSRQEMCRFW